MPGAHWLVSLLVLGGLLSACGATGSAAPDPPAPGGPTPAVSAPPGEPMDALERPVAHRLASHLDDDGVTLEYVDCPALSGGLPSTLRCRAFVSGVVAIVTVRVSREGSGGMVFDAWVDHGVVATARLVDRLERQGYAGVDCGAVPAYPARPGMRIICAVEGEQGADHVVATVTDVRGHVRIEDY